MTLRQGLSLIAIGASLAAAPAFAQNRDAHFDGPYISVAGGIAAQNNDGGDTLVFDTNRNGSFNQNVVTTTGANAFSSGFCNGVALTNAPGGTCRQDRDKAEYAVRLGYDKRLGNNFVGGVLIEGSKADSTDGTAGFSTTPASYSISRKLDYAISARARAGFTPGGGMLLYATGGGSYARIKHSFTTTNTANAFSNNNDRDMRFGYQVGGGAEIMLTDHVSLGLEYLYNNYKDDKFFVGVAQGTAPATNPFLLNGGGTNLRQSDTRFDFHSLRGTLSFQF